MITLLKTSKTVVSHTDVRGWVHNDFKASIANNTHLNKYIILKNIKLFNTIL